MAATPAGAAELNVVAAGAVRGIIGGMIDDYSRQSGLKFNLPSVRPDNCATPSRRASLWIWSSSRRR